MTRKTYLKKISLLLLLFAIVTAISNQVVAQSCTQIYTTANVPAQLVVTNGQVACVSGTGQLNGSYVVRAGGVLKVCEGTLTGSINIDPAWGSTPGGILVRSNRFVVNGAINNMGGTLTVNDANACDFVNPCTAPGAGTLTTPSTICAGTQTGINGSAVTGATYTWQKENTLNANDWVAIGGNTQNLAAATIGNLTTTTRFRRRTSACSPVQSSAWVTVTITVNALPTIDLDANNSSGKTGNDYQFTFIEKNGLNNNIGDANDLTIADDNANLASATIVLTNKQVGDYFTWTAIGGIAITADSSVANRITLNISGSSTKANYQTFIRGIKFNNGSTNPNTTLRNITFVVSDGSCASATAITSITVVAVNDTPVLDLDLNNSSGKTVADFQNTFTEGGTGVNISDIADTKITDADNTTLSSATIVLTNKQIGDYFIVGALTGITKTIDSSVANQITITLTGVTSLTNYENAIKAITFKNGSASLSIVDRIINVQVNDGSAANNLSNVAVATIHIVAVNDVSNLDLDADNSSGKTGADYQTTYTENATNVTIADADLTITDTDNTTLTSAIITLTNKFVGDTLFQGVLSGGLVVTKTSTAGQIVIKLSGTTTIANYISTIKAFQFYNKTEDPNTTDRIVKVRVFDGTDSSNVGIATIHVVKQNDCPTLSNATNYATSFTENGAKVVVVNSTFSITDLDLASTATTQAWTATIQLTNGVSLDSLFTPASANGFTVATPIYAYPNVTVSITGTGTAANLATLIKAITYKSGSENPSTTARTISIIVKDSDVACSGSGNSTISITSANDCPTLSNATNFATSFTENGAKVAVVNTTFSITDNDLASAATTQAWTATVQLTNGVSLDSLFAPASANGFTVAAPVYAYPNVTVSITGTGTAANLATLIKAITYKSGSDNPSTTARTVSIIVKDADASCSGSGNSTISITTTNDCPTLSNASNYATSFTENGAKVAVVNTTFSIADSDLASASTTQAWTATIQLTNGVSLDSLFTPASANGFTVATPVYAYPNVTVTISGTGTATNLATLIKGITYKSGSDNPSTTARTVSIVVKDADVACAGSGNSTISITSTNDCPLVDLNTTTVGNNDVATYFENAVPVNIIGNNISISDPDKTSQVWNVKVELSNAFALDSLFKSGNVGSLTIGNPDYTTIPGKISITISGTGTGVQIASAINGIKFKTGSENPDLTPRIITIDVSDDATPACKVSTVSTVNINAKNDCPVVDLNTNSTTDFSTIFVEQGAKVNVTSANVSITDVDNTTQNWTAKVELTNAVSLDSLFSSVTETGFTVNPVSYTSGKVTVNITGTGTGVQLGSIIKGITYKSGSLNPDVTTRNIVVSISDDSSCTSTANSTVTINLVNDASSLTLDDNNSAGTIKNTDFQTTFTEQSDSVNIGDVDTKITDVDNTTQSLATITLTNKKVGDIIKVGALTGGITASYDSSQVGKVIITLTGVTTLANYQDAIRNINFQNNRDNVDTTTRVVEVTVNDGASNSNIATSFIKVINVNDTVVINNETVVTNEDVTITNDLTTITSNDVDPDGDVLSVTGIVTSTTNGTINIVGNTYVYDPNKFFFGKDTAVFNVCDPKGACRKDTLFITVNPVSDGLFLDLDVNDDNDKFDSTGYQTTFTENDAHTGINITDTDVSIFNPDLFNMTSATFILTNKKLGDSLYVNGVLENGLTTSLVSTGNTLTLTVTGIKDSTSYKNLLTQIQFKNNRDDVDTNTRVINVTVANTDGTSNIAQSLIKVVNINDTVIVKNEYFIIQEDSVLTNTLNYLLANDTDPDGDVISIQTIVNYGNNGTFNISSGNFIYNPNKDFNGKDTIVVSVCDTKNACRNDSLFITVLPVNDNPILDLDKNNNHDTTLTVHFQDKFKTTSTEVSIADNDVYISDVDNSSIYSALIKLTNTKVGDSLIVKGTLPNGITDSTYTIGDTIYISLKGKSSLVNYQNAIKLVNFQHKDAIIDSTTRVIFVTVNDSLVNSNIAIATISIDNRSPLIVNDIYVTLEDSVLTNTLADILINDKDPEGAKLTVSSTVKNGSNGTFTTDGTNFTYNPNKDFNGRDTVVVSVCDIKNACKNDTLFITVVPVNDSPLLDLDKNNSSTKTGADYLTKYVENDTALSIGDVDVEITDVDNNTISSSTIKLVNAFAGDTLKVGGTLPNGITYTTTKVGDTIVVKFVGKGSLTTYQNLIKQTNFSSSKDLLDSTDRYIHVTVNDSVANSNVAITTITIQNVNDNPIVTVTNLVTKEDSTITGKHKDLLVNDKDPEGDTLVIKQVVKDGTNGIFVLTTDSTYSYTPDKDFNGKDTVIVSVCDPQGLCSNKTIIITVIPVNDNPILDLDEDDNSGKTGADYTTTFNENGSSLAINDTDISIKDVDNTNLVSSQIILTNTKLGDSLVIGTLPNGLIANTTKVGDSTIVNITGIATLVAYQDAISAIKFLNVRDDLDSTTRVIKVTVNDSLSTSNIATTTIKVNSVNDDPIIKSDTLTVIEDISITKDFKTILANDKDPENTTLTVTGIVKNGTKGNVTFTDSTYTYNPNLNVNGKDTVVFTVCDSGWPLPRLCKNDTLFINIIPVNDDPIVKNEYVTIKKNNTGVNVNFLSNDSDVETTMLSSGIVKSSTNGKVSNINLTTGTFTYVPDRYFVGIDTIIFTVCDQGLPLPAICKEDTIFINVQENNANCTIIDLDGDNSSKQLGYDFETTFVENSAAINITDTDLYIWDIDENQTELYSAKVVLTNTQAGDSMYYAGPVFPKLTTLVSKVNNNWEITFTGLTDTSYYRQAIAQIKFVNNRDDISGVRREIKFTLNDGSTAYVNGNCNNSATTYINVVPVHDNANIENEYVVIKEDSVWTTKQTFININDISIDGDTLIVKTDSIVKQGSNGVFVFHDSTFTYSPKKDFNGKDSVVVLICEKNKNFCYSDTIFIFLTPVNDSIIVHNEYHTLAQGQTVNGSIIVNDTNPDGGGVRIHNILINHINDAINPLGTLTITDSIAGLYTYVANKGVTGTDIYVYTVCSQPGSYSCKYDTLFFKVGGEVIPTGFSPNGDGTNDTYKISFPESYGTASIEIYNRWGAIVFVNDNYPNSNDDYSPMANEWNGTSNKGVTIGNELPDGTYFVHLTFSNNSSATRILAVTLQR